MNDFLKRSSSSKARLGIDSEDLRKKQREAERKISSRGVRGNASLSRLKQDYKIEQRKNERFVSMLRKLMADVRRSERDYLRIRKEADGAKRNFEKQEQKYKNEKTAITDEDAELAKKLEEKEKELEALKTEVEKLKTEKRRKEKELDRQESGEGSILHSSKEAFYRNQEKAFNAKKTLEKYKILQTKTQQNKRVSDGLLASLDNRIKAMERSGR